MTEIRSPQLTDGVPPLASKDAMTSPSRIEPAATRFAPHIVLLQDFLRSRDVPFGSSEELRPFAERLSIPGTFHEDMCAMLRTVMYRENMSFTKGELLELLCIAVGGTQSFSSAGSNEEVVGQVLVFVNIVLLSLKRHPFEQDAEQFEEQKADRIEEHGAAPRLFRDNSDALTAPTTELPPQVIEWQETPAQVPIVATQVPIVATRMSPLSPIPSSAKMQSSKSEFFDADPISGSVPEGSQYRVRTSIPQPANNPTPLREDMDTFAVPLPLERSHARWQKAPEVPLSSTGRQRRFLSLPATLLAGAVLTLLAFGIFWPHHKSAQQAPAAVISDAPASPLPKPSAYGPPMGDALGGTSGDSIVNAPTNPVTMQQHSNGAVSLEGTPSSKVGLRSGIATPAIEHASVPAPGSASSQGTGKRPSQQSANEGSSPGVLRPLAPTGSASEPLSPTSTKHSAHTHDSTSVQHVGRRGLFIVSSGVMSAYLVSAPPPEYPMLARMTHLEGRVILQAVVARNGSVIATHILQGHHLLRGAAEHAVKSWRYRPYLIEGRATDVETIVSVDFHLRH